MNRFLGLAWRTISNPFVIFLVVFLLAGLTRGQDWAGDFFFALLIGLTLAAAIYEWGMHRRKKVKPVAGTMSDEEIQARLDKIYGRNKPDQDD